MTCKQSTPSNTWFCAVMGTLIVLSILACDDPAPHTDHPRFAQVYALGALVDVRLQLTRGEVIFGVESMDDTMVELVEQADKTLTFKALNVGQTDIVIKTNRQTHTYSMRIEAVWHVQMQTQCGTQPNGFDDAFRMVLPGATLQTQYTLSSGSRLLLGRSYVTLPMSVEESYDSSIDTAQTRLVYQVPADTQGRWSLHADVPDDLFVVNLTTIMQEDIDAFELYPYPNRSFSSPSQPTTSLPVDTTSDFSLLPMHKGFKVCGLDLNTINAQTTTPEVCNITIVNDELQQQPLTYDVLRVEGLRKGSCVIEVLDGRGDVWTSTVLEVR